MSPLDVPLAIFLLGAVLGFISGVAYVAHVETSRRHR